MAKIGRQSLRQKTKSKKMPKEEIRKRGLLRASIERLESLETATVRGKGTDRFPDGQFVVVTSGPNKGKAGTVVALRRSKLGTQRDLVIKVGMGRQKTKGEEIIVMPRRLVKPA